jgi:hypothetical protein
MITREYNIVKRSKERDSRKYKCSALKVHIPRRSAKNIMKSSTRKYISIRGSSTCIDNGSTLLRV